MNASICFGLSGNPKIEVSKKMGDPKKHRSFEKWAILWMIWCCPNHFFGNLQFNMDHFLHASLLFGINYH
jgi:hypothetical protein